MTGRPIFSVIFRLIRFSLDHTEHGTRCCLVAFLRPINRLCSLFQGQGCQGCNNHDIEWVSTPSFLRRIRPSIIWLQQKLFPLLGIEPRIFCHNRSTRELPRCCLVVFLRPINRLCSLFKVRHVTLCLIHDIVCSKSLLWAI